jgi:hypothetical protein
MVAMAILAIGLGVATAAIISSAASENEIDFWQRELDAARTRSIRTGQPVVVWPDSAHLTGPVLFLPDGRAAGLDDTTETS